MEILSPAGNLEKLKTALMFGADAVYCGIGKFSLRTAADNFTFDELCEGVSLAHSMGKKIYITANAIPHESDISSFVEICEQAVAAKADALIISDLGAFDIATKYKDKIDLHVSTQSSNTNHHSLNVWHRMGASRIVLARELSFDEIREIRKNISPELELEMFVHGAMCMSYSGRCLLSNYLTYRDSNRGACAQPCRWKYFLTEEKRQGEYMEIAESDKGTFIFNSKDLCLINQLPEITELGVDSLKIEGRMKSSYYTAIVTKAYRQALDDLKANPDVPVDSYYFEELCKVSHRDYYTGFAFGAPGPEGQIYGNSSYIREYDIIGIIKDTVDGVAIIEQKNRFFDGDEIEIVPKDGRFDTFKISGMTDSQGVSIDSAPHAQMEVRIRLPKEYHKGTILRKIVNEER